MASVKIVDLPLQSYNRKLGHKIGRYTIKSEALAALQRLSGSHWSILASLVQGSNSKPCGWVAHCKMALFNKITLQNETNSLHRYAAFCTLNLIIFKQSIFYLLCLLQYARTKIVD